MIGYEHLTTAPAADMLRTEMRRRGLSGWNRPDLSQQDALDALAVRPPPPPPPPDLDDRPASLAELGAILERLSRG